MFRPVAAIAVLLIQVSTLLAFTPTSTPVSPEGTRAAIDLPADQHQQNSGGSDGAGLCVFTSAEVAGFKWQGLDALEGFQKWMEGQPGGGWPEKFDRMLKKYCGERGLTVPPYLQHEGGDTKFLELALKTRRAPCITYAGMDDFYEGAIAHMVVLGNFGRESCVLDNNRAGKWVWMTEEQLTERWLYGGGGWAYVFLTPPPPPGVDEIGPGPKPKPKPKPKPRRPLFPRWEKVTFFDGEMIWKLFDGEAFLGVWSRRGWHDALTSDGWSPEPRGVPPLLRPDGVNRWYVNGRVEVTDDWFKDDSDKPFVTVVVKDAKERADVLKTVSRVDLSTVHFNIYVSDFWAAKRMHAKVTGQKAFDSGDPKPVFESDTITEDTVRAAVDRVMGKLPQAPEPKPVDPVKPSSPVLPPSTQTRLLVPSWAFWGAIGAVVLGVYYVRSR